MAGYLEYKPPAEDNATELELSKIESLSVEPVMSLDDLNVSHLRHTLRVRCLFTATTAATFYSDLRTLYKVLMTPRGRLIISTDSTKATVLHDIDSNQNVPVIGLRPDVDGGPKPRSFEIAEFITGVAAHVIWTVEYNTIPCDTDADTLPDVLSRHHSATFDYSDEGRLTRTIEGELRIPDRLKSAEYSRNVQTAQTAAYFHVPNGWRRTSANVGISPNGLVLQFRYVDEELELGWHDLAQSMDLDWTERSTLIPATIEYTYAFRVKGRRGILKRVLINKIIIPMANDLSAKQTGSQLYPGASEWKEDLLTNEVSGSITWLGRPFDPAAGGTAPGGSLTSMRYLPPSQQFGRNRKQLRRINPVQHVVNGKPTNFDSVFLADENNRQRWETLPLLTRLIVKDLCDRSRLDPTDDYEEMTEVAETVQIELFEEDDRPEPESNSGEAGNDDRRSYLEDEPFIAGNYIVDEEVMQVSIDYHTEVIGNQNIININDDGELELAEAKSQRLYQDKVPTLVVKAVGRAVRINEQAAPRPFPQISVPDDTPDDPEDDVILDLVPQKVKVTTFGPHVGPGGEYPTYGVQWSYVMTRELSTAWFEITADAMTAVKIPKRPTRVSKLFTAEAMKPVQWNADDVL